MTDWLIERGIGESRCVRIEDGRIFQSRVLLEGQPCAGTILEARLKSVRPAAVAVANGQEYLLSGPVKAPEGSAVNIEVTREIIPGIEPWKRPQARVTETSPAPAAEPRGSELPFPAPADPLEEAGWSDLLDEARSGIVGFPGGELRVSVTPAMTLIDVDGTLPLSELTIAGARAAAEAIVRHGVGGSIGIDLPVKRDDKASRQKAAAVIDELVPQPFERTAVNGFGFIQIIRRRAHASLFELAADRPAFEARALLRRAARSTGAINLVAHPAVIAVLGAHPEWLLQLERQVGGTVTLRPGQALAMSGGYAERS